MLPRIDWSRRFPSFSQRKYNVTPRSSIFPPDPTDRPFIMKTSARDKLPASKGKAESHTRVRKQNGFICHPFNTTVSRTFDTCDVWSTCSRAGATDTLTFPTGRPTVEDVITHCYPLERISATAHVSLAMDSAPRDCTGYAVKPGTDWTRDEDRAIHLQSVDSYLDKFWAVFSQVFQTPRLDRFFTNPIQITTFCGAINLKEYRADFAFEESIQNMKLCANSGSHQALASTRFLHKTCSQGK
ncbi:hypothetical protein Bbelb_433700 [Branchiostoma belcheri]|nr:hypothetical protein Bbelb_433700 [Branchiostoma belcheri]